MPFPDFNENGDLPVGIHKATLEETLEHFGKGSLQRQLAAQRFVQIYKRVKSTSQLSRFIIYGSFVTSKSNPKDVDIFLVMDDDFRANRFSNEIREIFERLQTEKDLGASVFWMLRASVMVNEKVFIEGWQTKRDKTLRGIAEIIGDD